MKPVVMLLTKVQRVRLVSWAVVVVGSGIMAGCAGTDPGPPVAGGVNGSFGPGYPSGSAAWSEGARLAYRMAFMAGLQDQREGYRFDDDRGALTLDVEERGFYRQGYRRGYYHDAGLRRRERMESASKEADRE